MEEMRERGIRGIRGSDGKYYRVTGQLGMDGDVVIPPGQSYITVMFWVTMGLTRMLLPAYLGIPTTESLIGEE